MEENKEIIEIDRKNHCIKVTSDFFDAADTLGCGQVFRYCQSNDGYNLFSLDKKCFLFSKGNQTTIVSDELDYFYNYFDLDTDYGLIHKKLCCFPELFEPTQSCGIHILRQNLLETIISFIISANNNIKRIQGIIEKLCINYGEKKSGFYAFPTLKQLESITEKDYILLGCGYRSQMLQKTVKMLSDGTILDYLQSADYPAAKKELLALSGVGEKVADCIALFGLHHTSSYPVDTWISKADGMNPKQAAQKGREIYGDLAGFAQQFKFHSIRNRKNHQAKVQK